MFQWFPWCVCSQTRMSQWVSRDKIHTQSGFLSFLTSWVSFKGDKMTARPTDIRHKIAQPGRAGYAQSKTVVKAAQDKRITGLTSEVDHITLWLTSYTLQWPIEMIEIYRNHVQAIVFLHYWPVVLALLESHQTISAPLAPDGTCVMKRFNLGLATCSASVQLQWYDICCTKSWCKVKDIFCDFHPFFRSVSWCSMCLSYQFSSIFHMGLSENSVPLHPMVNDHDPY